MGCSNARVLPGITMGSGDEKEALMGLFSERRSGRRSRESTRFSLDLSGIWACGSVPMGSSQSDLGFMVRTIAVPFTNFSSNFKRTSARTNLTSQNVKFTSPESLSNFTDNSKNDLLQRTSPDNRSTSKFSSPETMTPGRTHQIGKARWVLSLF
mgnify:CR=1 FL=1